MATKLMSGFPVQTRLGLFLRFFQWHLVIMPVLVLYWLDLGLLMQEILGLQAAFSMALVLAEVPTGVLCDRIGRVGSLRLGLLLQFVGHAFLATAQTFEIFLVAEVVLGVAAAFLSGADAAFCFEHLPEWERDEQSDRLESWLATASTGSEGIAALWIGPVAALSLRWPFWIQAVISGLGFLLTLALREPPRSTHKQISTFAEVRRIMRQTSGLQPVFWVSALLNCATLTAAFFIQPYAVAGGIQVSSMGIYWAGLNLSVALTSILVQRMGRLSLQWVIRTAVLGVFSVWMGMAMGPGGVLVFMPFGFSILRGSLFPRLNASLQRKLESSVRATVMSLQSLMMRLVFSLAGPFLGFLVDSFSAQHAYIAAAVLFLVLTMVPALFVKNDS